MLVLRAFVSDFMANPGHRLIHGSRNQAIAFVPPNQTEQFLSGEALARMLEQKLKQPQFHGLQSANGTPDSYRSLEGVNHGMSNLKRSLLFIVHKLVTVGRQFLELLL